MRRTTIPAKAWLFGVLLVGAVLSVLGNACSTGTTPHGNCLNPQPIPPYCPLNPSSSGGGGALANNPGVNPPPTSSGGSGSGAPTTSGSSSGAELEAGAGSSGSSSGGTGNGGVGYDSGASGDATCGICAPADAGEDATGEVMDGGGDGPAEADAPPLLDGQGGMDAPLEPDAGDATPTGDASTEGDQ